MKTKVRLYLILLSILCSLNACSRGLVDEPKTKDNNTRLSSDTCMIRLSLEGKLNEARYLDYKVGDSGIPRVHLTSPIIQVHCIIRSDDPRDPATYTTLEFKVKGNNKVKLDLTEIPLQANIQNFRPGSGRKWYIMGIIGGELEVRTGRVNFNMNTIRLRRATKGAEVGLEMPYISDWIPLELRELPNGGYDAGGMKALTFKPQGVLFRIHTRNALPQSHIQVYEYQIQSRICDPRGYFDLNTPYGQKPQWNFAENMPEKGWLRNYILETPTDDIPAQTEDSGFYYLWMMPNRSSEFGQRAFSITEAYVRDCVSERLTRSSTPLLTTLRATIPSPQKTLRDGVCFTVRPQIQSWWNPLEQMDEVNYGGEYPQASRLSNHSNTAHQLYDFNQATEIAKQAPGWRLPTERDWITAVGDGLVFKGNLKVEGKALKRDINEEVQEFYTRRSVASKYETVKDQEICYAVRFLADVDSRCYSAWRYSIEKNPVSEGYIAVIRSCYLGPGSHEELKDINSESWWRNRKAEERRLPMAGRWAPENKDPHHPLEPGVAFYYWTSTLCYPDHHQYNNYHKIRGLNRFWFAHGTFGAPTNYACVRLFRDL